MAQTIQLKRSPGSTPPTVLAPGEPAWLDGNNTLYIGKVGGGVQAIAGDSAGYLKNNQTISFTGDASGSGSTTVNLSLANVVTAGSGTKITFDAKGRVTAATNLLASDIPPLAISGVTGLQSALDSKPTLVNGVLPTSVLPALSITDTFVVASQAAMLALAAQRGDFAVRTDITENFILQGDDPTQLSNWVQLLHPAAAAAGVQTVNNLTGPNVSLTASNIPFTPAGGVTSNNTQSAISELDTKKLSSNQTITFTGDATGSGATAVTLTLATQSGLTASTYPKVTVNAKGLVTAGAGLLATDIPAIAISGVTGLQSALDGKLSATAVIDGGTF